MIQSRLTMIISKGWHPITDVDEIGILTSAVSNDLIHDSIKAKTLRSGSGTSQICKQALDMVHCIHSGVITNHHHRLHITSINFNSGSEANHTINVINHATCFGNHDGCFNCILKSTT